MNNDELMLQAINNGTELSRQCRETVELLLKEVQSHIGRLFALEIIVHQLLALHLQSVPDKKKAVAVLKKSLAAMASGLEGEAKTICMKSAGDIYNGALVISESDGG